MVSEDIGLFGFISLSHNFISLPNSLVSTTPILSPIVWKFLQSHISWPQAKHFIKSALYPQQIVTVKKLIFSVVHKQNISPSKKNPVTSDCNESTCPKGILPGIGANKNPTYIKEGFQRLQYTFQNDNFFKNGTWTTTKINK